MTRKKLLFCQLFPRLFGENGNKNCVSHAFNPFEKKTKRATYNKSKLKLIGDVPRAAEVAAPRYGSGADS
jgi:hypothetical protein